MTVNKIEKRNSALSLVTPLIKMETRNYKTCPRFCWSVNLSESWSRSDFLIVIFKRLLLQTFHGSTIMNHQLRRKIEAACRSTVTAVWISDLKIFKIARSSAETNRINMKYCVAYDDDETHYKVRQFSADEWTWNNEAKNPLNLSDFLSKIGALLHINECSKLFMERIQICHF